MNPEMLDKLTELVDKQSIAETIYRYAQAVDRRDPDLLAAVFTADGWLHLGTYDGSAKELVARWRAAEPTDFLQTHHQVGNILVEFRGGGTAVAVTYLTALQRARHDGSLVDEIVRARYLDNLVKKGDGWLLSERRLVYDWSHVGPADERWWWEQPGSSALTGERGSGDPSVAFLAQD
jgi:3-phenylpropionate/cinnamic acid dioxygenase small subunit